MMALKEYNQGGAWCVYKKGTPQYDEVRKIQDRLKKGGPTLLAKETNLFRAGVSKEQQRKANMSKTRLNKTNN